MEELQQLKSYTYWTDLRSILRVQSDHRNEAAFNMFSSEMCNHLGTAGNVSNLGPVC